MVSFLIMQILLLENGNFWIFLGGNTAIEVDVVWNETKTHLGRCQPHSKKSCSFVMSDHLLWESQIHASSKS